jgi:crotonobetainyl-CoA:carnitine CoA-transferase CaiB-like acyl-CoA transferase
VVHRSRRDQGAHRQRIATKTTDEWLAILEPADIWCARVLNWNELMESEGFKVLDMLQTVTREDNISITTTRSPLRVNGVRPQRSIAPRRASASTARPFARSSACDHHAQGHDLEPSARL